VGAGTGEEGREYVIQIGYAESAAVEVIPAGSRPETSTPGHPWSSASHRPEDQGEATRVDAGRGMMMVANDRLKRAIAQLVGEFSPVIQRRYKEMAATTGTANGESKHRLEGIFSDPSQVAGAMS